MSEMRVMGIEGDTRIEWDISKDDEVAAARKTFDELTGKGYLAFKVGFGAGNKGKRLYKFDPGVEKMILAPPIAGG